MSDIWVSHPLEGTGLEIHHCHGCGQPDAEHHEGYTHCCNKRLCRGGTDYPCCTDPEYLRPLKWINHSEA